MGVDKGFELAHQGASVRIPKVFKFVMKYVSPIFLLLIFAMWVASNVFGLDFQTGDAAYSDYVKDLFIEPNTVAWLTITLIGGVTALFAFITFLNPDYKKLTPKD